jgi:hypothetical protein
MEFYWLLLGILAVWRLTHLLQAEDGPADLIVRLRRTMGVGFWARLMDCFYCLSLWIALPVACWTGRSTAERVLLWFAISAGAILLERLTNQHPGSSGLLYFEDKEKSDVLLRKPSGSGVEDEQ